jgi:hypothetical protein
VATPSKPDPDQQPAPWYRTSAAVSTAGVLGIVLVGGLVVTVVKMSDQWSRPSVSTVMTTVPTTQQTLRSTEPFIATPSSTPPSSFPTSVRVSTTDIGVPGETTTGSSETSPSESSTTRRTPRTQSSDENPTTTTRKRPRLNETRTLSP